MTDSPQPVAYGIMGVELDKLPSRLGRQISLAKRGPIASYESSQQHQTLSSDLPFIDIAHPLSECVCSPASRIVLPGTPAHAMTFHDMGNLDVIAPAGET